MKNRARAQDRPGSAAGRRMTRQAENAISAYNVVQTGPNSQLGGLNDGLASPAYHGRFGKVAIWPRTEAPATRATASKPNPRVRPRLALEDCSITESDV